MAQRIVFDNSAAQHIQAYIEYNNLVGDNGGKMLSDKEFEAYKKNYPQKSKNRIYAVWRNARGLDCKAVGPSSTCFCGDRFKEHEFLEPKNRKVHCKKPKCSCPQFSYVPVYGSNDFKCHCKHSYTEHDPITKKCSKGMCGCNKFGSTWSCSCGSKYGDHQTIFETRDERIIQGKSVDEIVGDIVVPGGLTSFAGLADGADRYETYIDQLGQQSQQKQIGNKQQQKMIQQPQKQEIDNNDNRNRLQQLNSKISNEKKINAYQRQEDPEPQNQFALEKQDRTLLNLFQTPHIYSNVSIPIRGQKRLMH